MAKIQYVVVQTVPDDRQNQLIVKADKPTETKLQVHIRLAKENKSRKVAEVDLNKKVMYMKRDHEKHYHYVSKSYGFNWVVVNDSAGWDTLVLTVRHGDGDIEEFHIPRKVILEHGRTLAFSGQGFEVQKFVPVEIIRQYKVKGGFLPVK